MTVKPKVMRLPQPIWKRIVYPVWLRWAKWWATLPLWRQGSYEVSEAVYWRGVRLICCRAHYCGDAADHPWDPGWGWSAPKASALWEPASARDRRLLALIGDPRERPS